ncbi:MAG TPA: hypothetical protein VK750_03225 [Cytophagaceae bacterium]|nr:hypothetical protein [Cytophagaceae bacterium]
MVGIIIVSHIGYDEEIKTGPSGSSYFGAIGAFGSALAHDLHTTHINNGKYDNALKAIEPEINPSKRLSDLYTSIYIDAGKTVIPIDIKLNERELEYFIKPTTFRKNYYEKDLRFLRESYKVDELLIVNMEYGVYAYKSYITRNAERNRSGYSTTRATLIDLNDNSIIIKTSSSAKTKLHKEWDMPPSYDLLKKTIKTSIDLTIANQWNQYDDWRSVKEAKRTRKIYDPVY